MTTIIEYRSGWEYEVKYRIEGENFDPIAYKLALNTMGSQGWELVTVSPSGNTLTFKQL